MEAQLAKRIVGGLKDAGISFVSYLPETRLSEIVPVLREDPSFMIVPVANEAEAVSISAGASLGGRPAAVYMEGSGVYVGSFNLLCLGRRLGVPMLLGTVVRQMLSITCNTYGFDADCTCVARIVEGWSGCAIAALARQTGEVK